jgi:hypothetical protein
MNKEVWKRVRGMAVVGLSAGGLVASCLGMVCAFADHTDTPRVALSAGGGEDAYSSLIGLLFKGPIVIQVTESDGNHASETVGIKISASDLSRFWTITLPCGNQAVYAFNEIPDHDVPCPCGDPTHWFVKYDVP